MDALAASCPCDPARPRQNAAGRPVHSARRISRDDRHFLVLPSLALVFARVPKAANSTIRYRLAADLGLKGDGSRPSNDAFWLNQTPDVARSLTRLQFARLAADDRPWCFTVVRHPVARLWSAWNNKVVENDVLSARLTAMGVVPGMAFDTFAERVAATPDADCDIHVRAQWAILALGDRLLPDHVARVEALEADWEIIRAKAEARSGRKLGRLQSRNVRAGTTPDVAQQIGPATLALIRDRFARDFTAFYPDG